MSRFAIHPPRSTTRAQTIMRSLILLASGSGLARRVRLLRHAFGNEEDGPVVERDALVADIANPSLEILTAGHAILSLGGRSSPEQAGGHRPSDDRHSPAARRASASSVVHGRLLLVWDSNPAEGQGSCHGTADAGDHVSAFRVPHRMRSRGSAR